MLNQPLIRYKIGNMNSTFMWLDNWHPLGPLFKRYGQRVCSNIGRSLNAKASSITHDGGWNLPWEEEQVHSVDYFEYACKFYS